MERSSSQEICKKLLVTTWLIVVFLDSHREFQKKTRLLNDVQLLVQMSFSIKPLCDYKDLNNQIQSSFLVVHKVVTFIKQS